MRRYRLKSSVEPLTTADGALFLIRAGDDDLAIRDASPADAALLELLAAEEPTLDRITDRLGLDADAARSKLEALAAAGVLTAAAASPGLDAEDAERFSRQLPYLADLGDAHALQRALADARVTVIGCGGLGTWAVAALAGAGVRRLRIVDDDVVERSNLNRQILYSPADLGVPKVEAAAAWLRAFDERIEVEAVQRRVEGVEAAIEVVDGADAVVLVADWPPYALARWVNAACVPRRIPFITGGQLPPIVKLGPLYDPGRTACFACHERGLQDGPGYDAYARRLATAPARGATLATASGMVGTALASDVVHRLVGAPVATAGAALLLDLRTLSTRREPIERDPACPVCQPQWRQTGTPSAGAMSSASGAETGSPTS
ncbi:TOMM precursor leader peptide-binding protein [Solirubrobacter phytolaccae]|uniref:TOMM leader peptide-binding protein n=1 Tax=Solirubrobacter phytolaccae TaxID=1404360 RepID=A0A9X3SAD0_9ACTN|nr:TOMM precursor leader peptide-binding protein [Solirubrobacter phytolaccae]MDA0184354.1 TOMM precursor leader peptide-binding protein [Solirubrobacter phytolaccae]